MCHTKQRDLQLRVLKSRLEQFKKALKNLYPPISEKIKARGDIAHL